MKRLVGKREGMTREAALLLSVFMPPGSPLRTPITQREFSGICGNPLDNSGCGLPVKMIFSEDLKTGEIWAESPDKCERCGHQLSNPEAKVTQSQIEWLFGKIGTPVEAAMA